MALLPTIGAGTTLSMSSAVPSGYTAAGFQALAYTQIRGVRSFNEIGEAYKTVEQNVIGSNPVLVNVDLQAQTLPLELIRITDAGQTMLKNALSLSTVYSFCITESDGMQLFFTAVVSSRRHGLGGSNSMADLKMQLNIQSRIIEV